MQTCGLVLTLSDDPELVESSLGEIAAAGPFTLNEESGPYRAVVLETSGPKTCHDWHQWIAALPGVMSVEVVFVHWSDLEAIHA